MQEFRNTFAQRQIDRLGGVVAGSLEVTGPLIEASYARLIAILRDHLHDNEFTFGGRPSAGDFALHGQLTQLVQVEPPSMALARAEAPCLLAWVDVVEDLSGLEVTEQDWMPRDGVPDSLRALFTEIGRTCAPFHGRQRRSAGVRGPRRWSPGSTACATGSAPSPTRGSV